MLRSNYFHTETLEDFGAGAKSTRKLKIRGSGVLEGLSDTGEPGLLARSILVYLLSESVRNAG